MKLLASQLKQKVYNIKKHPPPILCNKMGGGCFAIADEKEDNKETWRLGVRLGLLQVEK